MRSFKSHAFEDTPYHSQMDGREGEDVERQKPLLEPNVIKAFVAGLVLGNVNKRLLLGFLIGAAGGVFVQQSYGAGVPDVKRTWGDLKSRWNASRK